MKASVDIRIGDSLKMLKAMPSESVQMCCTSPPYYRLRKYGDDPNEMGQEKTQRLILSEWGCFLKRFAAS